LPPEAASSRADHIERVLEERGHTFGPLRIAAGKSGIAIGFPKDPIIHVSWWVLGGLILTVRILRPR
jgi:hypothetical protein